MIKAGFILPEETTESEILSGENQYDAISQPTSRALRFNGA